MTDRQSYRLAEVAAMFGVDYDTVLRWSHNGTIRTVKIGGTVLMPATELDRLLDTPSGDQPKPATASSVAGRGPGQ